MTRSKNANLTSETATRASYHGTNGRNQHSEMMPPFLHPLSYSDLQSRNREFFPFLKLGSYVHEHPETSAPPFCPPFWYIWKVQDLLYNLCIYHFSSKFFVFAVPGIVLHSTHIKIRCFRCTWQCFAIKIY